MKTFLLPRANENVCISRVEIKNAKMSAGTFDCRTPAVMTMGPAERTEEEIRERAPWGQPGGWDPRGWLEAGPSLNKKRTAHNIDYHGERRVVELACGI